ncbi:MAG: hypothetical protein KGL18_02980 [Burkholderiales bacterium]|nr:hypothetical protein [Burkholderiales bacterium]MDE2501930.1 hypothetical protein [Burkholderiales bacterium]
MRARGSTPVRTSSAAAGASASASPLACAPAALLADEPTTALDATLQRELLRLLRLLRDLVREDGMAMLLISHALGLIAEHIDELMVMYGGRIVEAGPTRHWRPAPRIPTRARCRRRGRGWARRPIAPARASRWCSRIPMARRIRAASRSRAHW